METDSFTFTLLYLCTQLKCFLGAKIESSDESSNKTSWMNYNFPHWFLTSVYAVSRYTVHSLHKLSGRINDKSFFLIRLYGPYVGPWPIFQFSNLIHGQKDSLDGGSARRKASTYTQDNTNTE
jgi:hypothetical protein